MRDLGIQNSKGVTQERKRTHNTESISIQRKRGIIEWSPSMEKRKRRRKKKEERRRSSSRRRRRDRRLCWQSAGCCFNWAQILFRCVLLLPFFFFFEELVFFGFFFFPYKSLCSRSEIIRSPSDLCSSSCSFISFSFFLDLIITSYRCIGQNSLEKLKQKEIVRTSKISHGSQNCMV